MRDSWRLLGAIVFAVGAAGCGDSSDGSGSRTQTPTRTATGVSTRTATNTATIVNTATATNTAAIVNTPTATNTAASTSTPTAADTATITSTPTATVDDRTVPATFRVNPGVRQVTVTGAAAKQALTLVDAAGERLITLIADTQGNATFANIPDEHVVY